MENKEIQDIVNLTTKIAFEEWKFHLDHNPKFITRRQAKRKYKTLLYAWERFDLTKPIRTIGCKHEVFPLHELELLYELYIFGKLGSRQLNLNSL